MPYQVVKSIISPNRHHTFLDDDAIRKDVAVDTAIFVVTVGGHAWRYFFSEESAVSFALSYNARHERIKSLSIDPNNPVLI